MSTRSSKRSKANHEPASEVSVKEGSTNVKEIGTDCSGVSEYERIRNENIHRNEEFLQTLGVSNSMRSATVVAKSTQVSRRGSDSGKRKPPPVATRRSGRMTVEKLKAEVEELEGEDKILKQQLLDSLLTKQRAGAYEVEPDPVSSWSSWDARERIDASEFSIFPAANQPADTDVNSWVRPMIDAFNESDSKPSVSGGSKKGPQSAIKKEKVKSEPSTASAQEYANRMTRLSATEDEVAKMTDSRITSVWVHPGTDKLIIGAGDKGGNLGIWDVNSTATGNGGVFKFKPHVGGISKLHAYDNEPSKLYSVSSDGTIRFLDLGKEAFVLGFTAPEGLYDISFNDASFASDGNTVFLGKTDGTVGLVDFRSKGANSYEWCFETQPTKINSVQQHPTDVNLLITAGSGAGGDIRIHDIRKAGAKWPALKTLNEHTKSVNAAYCSPDGRYIVSVGQDSTVRTWKNFVAPAEEVIWHATRHDNHTGRCVNDILTLLIKMHRKNYFHFYLPHHLIRSL
jgi:WD domain, G-beta repeat